MPSFLVSSKLKDAQPDPHKACALYDVGGGPVIKEKGNAGSFAVGDRAVSQFTARPEARARKPGIGVKFHERLAAGLDSEIALAPVEQNLLDFLNGRSSPSMMAQACRQNATMRATPGLDTGACPDRRSPTRCRSRFTATRC